MTFVYGTLAMVAVLNGLGLAVSLWMEKRGPLPGVQAWTAKRKPGALKARLPLILFNLFLLVALSTPSFYLLSDQFPLRIPGVFEAIWQFSLMVLLDDIWFYAIHRVLHENKWLYRKIHRIHHEAYAALPIEYIYAHPLEWMIGAGGPVLGLVLILQLSGDMSAFVFWAWAGWRIVHELDIHSGLISPIGAKIPFFAGSIAHDLHHARPTRGNYASSTTVLDRLLGTTAWHDRKGEVGTDGG
jgi:sterol desaturase/sphingolipid hydroxylase (fatty acid hydroxylase superfamily)